MKERRTLDMSVITWEDSSFMTEIGMRRDLEQVWRGKSRDLYGYPLGYLLLHEKNTPKPIDIKHTNSSVD